MPMDRNRSLTPQIERGVIHLKWVLIAVILGVVIGLGLADERSGETLLSWIVLIGDLFNRFFIGVTVLLTFTNAFSSFIEMLSIGRTRFILFKTFAMYLLTIVLAALIGILCLVAFHDSFEVNKYLLLKRNGTVNVRCPLPEDLTNTVGFWGIDKEKKLVCTSDPLSFVLDGNNVGIRMLFDREFDTETSFSTFIRNDFFKEFIDGIWLANYVKNNLLGLVVLGGLAAKSTTRMKRVPIVFIEISSQMGIVFELMLNWVMRWFPIAVVFNLIATLAEREKIGNGFSAFRYVILSVLLGACFQILVIYPLLYLIFVRKNPFVFYKHILPAQIYALSTSSAIATLPVTVSCLASTKEVPASVANIVLPIGASLNGDGAAIIFPSLLGFLQFANRDADSLEVSNFLSFLGFSILIAFNTASLSAERSLLLITAFYTIFGYTPNFLLIFSAVEWLLDRLRLVVNVTGNAVIARIVAQNERIESDKKFMLESEASSRQETI